MFWIPLFTLRIGGVCAPLTRGKHALQRCGHATEPVRSLSGDAGRSPAGPVFSLRSSSRAVRPISVAPPVSGGSLCCGVPRANRWAASPGGPGGWRMTSPARVWRGWLALDPPVRPTQSLPQPPQGPPTPLPFLATGWLLPRLPSLLAWPSGAFHDPVPWGNLHFTDL